MNNESIVDEISDDTNLNNVMPKFPNVELFESIDELPIWRYQAFHNYMIQDAGIGSSLNDITTHLAKMDEYMKTEMYREAQIERNNLQMTFYAITELISFRHMAYACLVKRIGKMDYSDVLTESGLKVIQEKLGKMLTTHKNIVDWTKKKKSSMPLSLQNTFLKSTEILSRTYPFL